MFVIEKLIFAVRYYFTFNKLFIIRCKTEERNIWKVSRVTRLLLSILIDFKIIPTTIKRYERFIEGLMLESCYFITLNNLSAVINQTEEKKGIFEKF